MRIELLFHVVFLLNILPRGTVRSVSSYKKSDRLIIAPCKIFIVQPQEGSRAARGYGCLVSQRTVTGIDKKLSEVKLEIKSLKSQKKHA